MKEGVNSDRARAPPQLAGGRGQHLLPGGVSDLGQSQASEVCDEPADLGHLSDL